MSQPIILLERDYLDDRTIGCLSYTQDSKNYEFATIEPKWLNNKKNVSCVPEGEYNAAKYPSKNFRLTFCVSVQDRTGILFHAGNQAKETEGCILLGEHFVMRKTGGLWLSNSAKAINYFLESLKDVKSFTLIIKRRVTKNGS